MDMTSINQIIFLTIALLNLEWIINLPTHYFHIKGRNLSKLILKSEEFYRF